MPPVALLVAALRRRPIAGLRGYGPAQQPAERTADAAAPRVLPERAVHNRVGAQSQRRADPGVGGARVDDPRRELAQDLVAGSLAPGGRDDVQPVTFRNA